MCDVRNKKRSIFVLDWSDESKLDNKTFLRHFPWFQFPAAWFDLQVFYFVLCTSSVLFKSSKITTGLSIQREKYWPLSFLVIFAIFWLIFILGFDLKICYSQKYRPTELTLFSSVKSCCSLLACFDFKSFISAYKVVIILRWFSLSTLEGMPQLKVSES